MGGLFKLSNLKSVLRDPSKIREGASLANRKLREGLLNLNRQYYSHRFGKLSESFVTDEWDTLVILDAARPEFLQDTTLSSSGEWATRYSPASYSHGFMQAEFSGYKHHDVVYITGNPYISKLESGIFHDVINLYSDAWDDDAQTVQPKSVVEAVENARERYPEKRYIAHFMQPHFPFLGPEYGNKIESSIPNQLGDGSMDHPWWNQMYGDGNDRETLLAAYKENHEFVAPYAQKIVDGERGTTVVTADHTNLIGERGRPIPIRQYGHPENYPHPDLLEVPWITFDGPRRDTRSDPPKEQNIANDESVVEERLTALGYAE